MNSIGRLLALAALLLGVLALVVRNPKEVGKVSVDLADLARMIEKEEDHVTADELATMLTEQRTLRIVDLRDSIAFARYHIPTAERIEMPQLISGIHPGTDTLILYSEGGIHAAQAWLLLKAKGHRNVFTLLGGLTEWRRGVKEFGGEFGAAPVRRDTTRSVTPQKAFQKESEKIREVC